MRHPREMGVADLEAFYPSWPMSARCQPSITTKLIPAVLPQGEVTCVLAQMEGVTALLAGGTDSPLDLLLKV